MRRALRLATNSGPHVRCHLALMCSTTVDFLIFDARMFLPCGGKRSICGRDRDLSRADKNQSLISSTEFASVIQKKKKKEDR